MQSDDDFDIVNDLSKMMGLDMFQPRNEEERQSAVCKLNDGLFTRKFDMILEPGFEPYSSHHAPGRIAVILGILAMLLGAKISDKHMNQLRILRIGLGTMEEQLQLLTALDEYKNNGTRWVSGSKLQVETRECDGRASEYDIGDEFWFSGLGHNEGEKPTSDTYSKRCLACRKIPDPFLLRCSRCKMARYCNADCQRVDWLSHIRVCELRKEVRSCPVPDSLEDIEGVYVAGKAGRRI
ncbi:hypothetical protein F4778DRAFT_735922 [Xylariomycetidae sp. FL2044]|nr:hypothetical protein F4778DRAFT_735922 [Xylariomycetidae sp. FL2044]